MLDIMDFFNPHSVIVKIIMGLVIIFAYSMFSVFINKVHNAVHGKTTVFAWIPGTNVLVLGKLAAGWIVGIIMFLGLLFGICITFDIKGLEVVKNIMPKEYVFPYQIGYIVLLVILFIVAQIKLKKIIRSGTGKDEFSKYVSKDFDKSNTVVAVTDDSVIKPQVEEQIKDNYQYNNVKLTDLSNHDNEENPK